jgi:hypothetical protein
MLEKLKQVAMDAGSVAQKRATLKVDALYFFCMYKVSQEELKRLQWKLDIFVPVCQAAPETAHHTLGSFPAPAVVPKMLEMN